MFSNYVTLYDNLISIDFRSSISRNNSNSSSSNSRNNNESIRC